MVLTSLFLFQVRKLQLEEEVEKRRVLEDALHVLATEHHALEYSLGVHEVSCQGLQVGNDASWQCMGHLN